MPPKPKLKLDLDRVKAELCKKDFYFFVQQFWHVVNTEEPVWNWHIEYLCNEAQRIVERLKRREPNPHDTIVNVPPGTSKSTIWTIMLPAWAWTVDETLRSLTISYSDMLATEHAVKSRDIIRSDQYRKWFPEVEVKKDKDNKTNYENTKNGQRMAAGLSGTITGIHAHLIIVDDPLNPKQAASDIECATANRLIDTTLSTRKVDKAVTHTVLVMQRLSENDPTAHLLAKKGKRIKHIKLPAEVRDGVLPMELEDQYVNGLLDPVRLSEQILADQRIDLGSFAYAGQFSQKPAPEKGAIWQRWFNIVPDAVFPDKRFLSQYGTDWDLAYTKDDTNAASAFVTAGKLNNNIYIDAIGWDWLEFPGLIRWMNTKPSPHYIEAKASGKSAKQTLTENGVPAIEVQVEGGTDKIARARMATPTAEAGLVYVRESIAEKLYSDAQQGILNFPRGKFKDLADTLSQALQRLKRKSGLTVSEALEPEGMLDEVEFD